jgi:glycosyltransferase involved in cell wall biosynthesis
MPDLKRVLMIVFHYPPWSGGSGVHRSLKFSRYLPEYGWQPIVLTASRNAYPQNASHGSEIPAGVTVSRAFALDSSRHLAFRGAYPKWIALPDRWVSWWPSGVVLGLRLLREYRPHVIWSTYPIATSHLIALSLHRLTGTPWVADFRDPMTEVDPQTGEQFPTDPSIRKANSWIEGPTVRHCTRAVFTTPGTQSMYATHFPEVPHERWTVIPNGYDEEDFTDAERSIKPRPAGGPTVLVHSGLLYPDARNPRPFFEAVADLLRAGRIQPGTLKIILRASGYDDLYRPQLRELGIDGIVSLEPAVSYRQALAEILSADGLLIFQAANCNWQIPAKLYECLRARRPIFALTDPEGDTAAVLKPEGGTIVRLDSKNDIADGLLGFLSRLASLKNCVSSGIEAYSRKSRTRELAAVLDSVPTPKKL